MARGPANPEIKQKILDYLQNVQKAKSRDIAVAIGAKKSEVDDAVKELTAEDLVEYLYITTTYICLKGKAQTPV
jgi:Mn-dependent DtxR family transcriptional regulator